MWFEIAWAVGEEAWRIYKGSNTVDYVTQADLQKGLDDAVQTIQANTEQAILSAKLTELKAGLASLDTNLREYQNAPNNDDRLGFATNDATNLVENLRTLDLIDPFGSGLAGFPGFMIASGLKTIVLQERVKRFGSAEKKNLVAHLLDSIAHVGMKYYEWVHWNARRFTDLSLIYSGKWVGPFLGQDFSYMRQHTQVKMGYNFALSDSNYSKYWNKAEPLRQRDISSHWQTLETEIILPSNKIKRDWESLARQLEKEPVEHQLGEYQQINVTIESLQKRVFPMPPPTRRTKLSRSKKISPRKSIARPK